MSRRAGIIDTLEQCFETSSRSKAEAMNHAHYNRELQNAAQKGDVELVKQLTLENVLNSEQSLSEARTLSWAELKFKA